MIFIVKFIYELISSFQDYISTYISNKYTYNVSRIVFQKLLRFPMSFFEKYNLGEITSRVNGDIGALSIMVDSQIIELFTSFITLVGMIIIMAKLNIIMFLISCLTAPIIVITNNRIAEQQKKASREIRSQYDKKSKCIQEMVLGIREIKYLNIFKWAEKEFIYTQNNIFRENMRINKVVLLLFVLSNRLYEIVYTGVYLTGAYILVKGNFTVGELFAFLTYFNRAISIIERLTRFNGHLQSSLVSMERIYEILEYRQDNLKDKINEGKNNILDIPDRSEKAPKISFNNISFTYDSNYIFKNANFNIFSGEKVALIGKNGSGKSTVLNLIMKFLEPDSGIISYDGIDISKIDLSEVTKKISYVPQKPFIFNYSLKENILLGTKKVTDEAINQVLEQVGLLDFINSLDNGLDTPLMLNGSNISGGQLQRLAIARALLRRSEVLLLDEVTSNIEEQFEEEFIKNIVNNYKKHTAIMTIHKYRLLKYFDKVLYVDSGNVLVTSPKDFEVYLGNEKLSEVI